MALLSKFIHESPDDAAEMPEALLRIGELEWEDARDQFLPASQMGGDAGGSARRAADPELPKPRVAFCAC